MGIFLRNQIPCAAPNLSQLQPDMIQAVAPRSAFTIGHQYFTQRRVRIIQADEEKISSEVGGANGLYHQTIRLTDGNLVTKCSCPSNERPLCRHCVAALLEYARQAVDHRGADISMEKRVREAEIVDVTAHEVPVGKPATDASPLGAGLREITVFIDWLQAVVHAVKAEQPLPVAPNFGPGDALDWVSAIQMLEEESRQSKEYSAELETRLSANEGQLSVLTQDLKSAHEKAKEVKAAFDETRLELEKSKGRVTKLLEIEKERNRLADLLKNLTGDMKTKAEKLDQLAADLKNSSNV